MENEEHFDELYENPRGFLDRVVADVVEGVGEERVEAEEDAEPIPESQPKREVPRKRKWYKLWGGS